MEISRKNLRNEVLERIKFVRTCVMARELCVLVRTNRAVLEPEMCRKSVVTYRTSAKKKAAVNQATYATKAAKAIGSGDEEKYLDLCAQSCVKCGEAKSPRPKNDPYVA